MKKNVFLSSFVVAVALTTLAQAHEFKNEKLKNFYGNARVYLGYQLGMNEAYISQPKYRLQEQYEDAAGITRTYDALKRTHHQLSIGAGYNFYYKGFSKVVHPFIGVKGQIGIPLSAKIDSDIGLFPKKIFDDETKTFSADNLKKVDQSGSLYNFLEVGGKVGTKFNINKNIAVETFIGYGKTMSTIVENGVNVDGNGMYRNNKGESVNKIQYLRASNTYMTSVYSVGADVVFNVSKQTFTAGLEYKFVDFSANLGNEVPKHYLSFNLGYQFF